MSKSLKKHPVFGIEAEALEAKLPDVSPKQLADAFNASIDPEQPTPETHTAAIRREVNRRIGQGGLG